MQRFRKCPHAPLFVASLAFTIGLAPAVLAEDEIVLESGDTLHGSILDSDDQQVTIDHPVLGELILSLDQIDEISFADPAEVDEPLLTLDPDAADELDDEELGFFEGWENEFTLGFSGSEGNSRNLSVNSRLRMLRENDYHRWNIEASYYYGRDRGVRSENEFRLQAIKDWLIPEDPWFFFVEGNYEYNEFRQWRQRVGLHGGVGYTFIDEEHLEINARGGLGGSYEVENDDFIPEALFGGSLARWHITESQNLTGGVTIFPNLDDTGEFRLNSNLEWTIDLDHMDNMSVRLGLENRYESDPGPDRRRNDFKYYGAVVIDF